MFGYVYNGVLLCWGCRKNESENCIYLFYFDLIINSLGGVMRFLFIGGLVIIVY